MSEKEPSREEANRPGQTEPVPNTVKPQPSADRPKVRDRWDYIELFLRYASPFVTALTIALLGWLSNDYARHAQLQETARNETSQNYRLYTELLSQREDAESALRRDMFMTILEKFFKVGTSEDGKADMEKQLLKLEMLALNFGESLSLSPLFISTDHAITSLPDSSGKSYADRMKAKSRLESLAKRVADQQLSALLAGGESWDIVIPLYSLIDWWGDALRDENNDKKTFTFPYDVENFNDQNENGTFQRALEGIDREYSFKFSQFKKNNNSVHVDMVIQEEKENGEVVEPVERGFDLNYFNFPMVDNTRLSSDQRFALVLTGFSRTELKATAIIFPGKYSGQRDKPFLDDVIHRLKKSSRDIARAEEGAGSPTVSASSTQESEKSE